MTDKGDLIAGRYRLLARLGSGGMGVVWRGWDERLHRTVAIKQLVAERGLTGADAEYANERAIREGRITARLQHPHAIPVYDVAEHEGQPCLIMQFLPSRSLHEVLTERGTLPVGEVAQFGSQVASALAAAHQAGIVHRDIKPGNVLIAEDGSAKITDFGISRALGDLSVTSAGMLAGTPAYLAPEVARGQEADLASDVFSLGATLYTALEGQPPFGTDEDPTALLRRVATGEIRPPRRSGPITDLLFRMLHPDPRMRPSMRHVESELAALAAAAGPLEFADATAVRRTAVGSVANPAMLRARPGSTRVTPAPTAAPPARPRTPLPAPIGQSPGPRRRRRAAVAVAVTVAVLVAATVLVVVLSARRDRTGASSGQPPAASVASTGPVRAASSPVTTPASASPAATTAPASSVTPSPTPSATPTTTAAGSESAAATARVLERVITDYYALMPDHLVAGWTRLTPDYQQNHAQGFTGYAQFWAPIARVQLRDVSAQPPDTVSAMIRYHYRNGQVIDEQTTFRLVFQGGEWKIADSSVSSSTNG